ncbi:MAG: DnaB-like helicase C-terminal domain-containing protein [Nanopusillaceae archaeon]
METSDYFYKVLRCLLGDVNSNNDAKRKQKVLAEAIDELLNVIPINPVEEELFRCLKAITKAHKDSDLPGNLISTSLKLDLYPNFKDLIIEYSKQILDVNEIQDYITLSKTVLDNKLASKDIDTMINELISLKNEDYTNRLSDRMFEILSKKYMQLLKTRLEDSTEMRLTEDRFDKVIESLKSLSVSKQIVPSRFDILDSYYLKGGFESGRIYVFGGKPGGGKSTILINFLAGINFKPPRKMTDKPNAIVYISLENDISETYDRLFSLLLRKNIKTKDLTDEESVYLKNVLFNSNSSCEKIVKYMTPYSTSTVEIMRYVETLSSQYNVKLILVDYLDLLRSSQGYSEKRFELGQVTSDLRVISKKFSCPVVTVTQLNTSGYKGIPTMVNVDESRQKVQNADFIALLFDIDIGCLPSRLQGGDYFNPEVFRLLGVNVDKNRDGKVGKFVLGYRTDIFLIEPFKKSDSDTIINNYFSKMSNFINEF